MSTTPNMSLIVPDVGTSGPTYATEINTAFDVVDAHDHTPGKGVRIPPSGLNINADLPFNNNDAISLRSTRYTSQTGVLATSDDRNCISSVNGNLYWNNANGVAVQITAGNGLNFASLGTIGGDYGAAGVTAAAVYTNLLKTFSWTQAAGQYAKMAMADLSLYSTTAGTLAVTLKASASTTAYDITMPISAPIANTFMRTALGGQGTFVTLNGTVNQITVTQNTSDVTFSLPQNIDTNAAVQFNTVTANAFFGAGANPIGTIIAIGDAGAWALPASGAIKDGYALCNGQAKPVGSAAGLAANLPNLTDNRFLNGSNAVGGTGGATSKTTTGIAATFNKNLLNSDQVAHSHGMDHRHELGRYSGASEITYFRDSLDTERDVFQRQSFAYASGVINDNFVDYRAGLGTFTMYTRSSIETAPNTGSRTSTDNASISWNSATVSTSVTQGSISDIRPNYFNVVYVMRVA